MDERTTVSLLAIFSVVFLAELPCMVRTMGLQMYSGEMFKVIAGTVAGNLFALVFGIIFAKILVHLFKVNNFEHVSVASGILFILLGLYMIFVGE